jgi:polyisoprenoid-binding protein YceI
VHLPEDLTAASFEVRLPVEKLTVDEADLRKAESSSGRQTSEEWPPEVPESAREGTRRNMLGEALLNAERYPEIVLRSERIEVVAPNELLAHVQVTVRDRVSSVTVPVHHEMKDGALVANAEFALNQTDLGLTPFSVMMGALQVKDEMKIRFNIHCVPSGGAN